MDAVVHGSVPAISLLPGEHVVMHIQPAPSSIFVRGAWPLAVCAIVAGAGVGSALAGRFNGWGLFSAEIAIAAGLVILAIANLQRRATRFLLTDRRIAHETGLFTRNQSEVGPSGVRHIIVQRSILERVFGLGTIAVSAAGPETRMVIWWNVAEPDLALSRVRERLAAWNPVFPVTIAPPARSPESLPDEAAPDIMDAMSEGSHANTAPDPEPESIPVIGLAGGIGAGKSFVAHLFEQLGCYVVDSDTRAKAALDRPEVRDELVRWWGDEILAPEGRVDRAAISRIVFAEPAERERLEALVHPLVRQDRARLIEEAADRHPKAIIIDAPLLFEAGVDKECDSVIFIESPFEERLRRVEQTRSWDRAELERREASQWPLAKKRAASQFVLQNTGSEADILKHAAEVLAQVRFRSAFRSPDAS